MRRHLMLGTVFSAALAVGAAAQSAGQSPASQSPTGQDTKSSSAAQTITVTGCLKADTSSPSASPGAPANAPASSASAGFILEESGAGGAANPASPTESPTATSGSSSNKTYKLSGGSGDLASLVGKKVEVKGTLASRAGGAPESSPGAAMGDSKAQQLRVTSVKEVPGSCSK